MKIKFFTISVILLCLYPDLFGSITNLKISPVKKEIEIQPGGSGIIALNIEIPDNSYIYGNPKGPGVGKPTIINVKHPDNLSFGAARFKTPKKYYAEGDADFVWIYEKETSIDIPFTVKENSKAGDFKISILINALLCTNKTCILHDFTVDFTIKVHGSAQNINSSQNGQSLLNTDGANSVNTGLLLNKDNKIISEKVSIFTPRFISEINIGNIINAILYGVLAGFILNFMPCVLPVISLKVLDIIKYSGNDRKNTQAARLRMTA